MLNEERDVIVRKRITELSNLLGINQSRSQSGEMEFEPPLDAGIAHEVEILYGNGIETFESCEGGAGHCFPEPTVRFHGERSEGFKALAIAMQNALKPSDLRRIWTIIDGEPVGPYWEMTFTHLVG